MSARRRTSSRKEPRRRRKAVSARQVEWLVYALAAGKFPSIIRLRARRFHVLGVGRIAVIGAIASGDTKFTETELRRQHAIVIDLAERFDPLLPVRFGTRIARGQLEAIIRQSEDVLMAAMDTVRGRQQMTLRLVGVATSDRPPAAGGSGADYLRQRRAAYSVPDELQPIREAVKRLVVQERVAPGRAGIRATLFHLVDRGSTAAYRQVVERAAAAMPPGSISVTGPWPPFAFAPELLG